MAPKQNDSEAHWLNPLDEARDHLNAFIDTEEVPPDMVIVDPVLREKAVVKQDEVRAEEEAQKLQAEMNAFLNGTSVPAPEARVEEKVLDVVNERKDARVLFFTKDETVLVEGSPTHKRITDLRYFFAEVHIILLNYKSGREVAPVMRIFDTVWLYTTESTSWWKLSFDAYKIAEKQLVFSGGFRADVLVAEDLYESGLAAWFVGKKYARPVQIHTYEDFSDDAYMQSLEHPTLYTWSVHYLLKRVQSIRTKTELERQAIIKEFGVIEDAIEVLPNYYDLTAWRDFVPSINLHERYPQFKFIILHVSSMRTSSRSKEVLLGVSPILRRYATVGLVVVGNGPLRSQLEKQAIALGLQNQIEFEPMPQEVISHLKSANVLVHLSEDGAEDDLVLSAASVRIPMVVNKQGVAGQLFTDNKSARLCESTDITCVTESINMYLNDNNSRTQFAIQAQDIVFTRVEQDHDAYVALYADSIKRSLAYGG